MVYRHDEAGLASEIETVEIISLGLEDHGLLSHAVRFAKITSSVADQGIGPRSGPINRRQSGAVYRRRPDYFALVNHRERSRLHSERRQSFFAVVFGPTAFLAA